MMKNNLGSKGFISTDRLGSVIQGSQDKSSSRNMEVGADAETLEEYCLLAFFPWLAQPTNLPRDGTIHSRLGPPTSISCQENSLQTCPWASLRNSSIEILFPGMSRDFRLIKTVTVKLPLMIWGRGMEGQVGHHHVSN